MQNALNVDAGCKCKNIARYTKCRYPNNKSLDSDNNSFSSSSFSIRNEQTGLSLPSYYPINGSAD